MGTVEEIEQAVEQLSPADFARFRSWFETIDAARFDRRIEDDAASGKLDALADAALEAMKRGQARDL